MRHGVIPHLYERFGDDFVDASPRQVRHRGLGRAPSAVLVLARDRLGIKPLYYAVVDDVLVFGSELKSLLASGLVPTQIDLRGRPTRSSRWGSSLGRRPFSRRVQKLLRVHRLVVDRSGVRVERYWDYPAPDPQPFGRR